MRVLRGIAGTFDEVQRFIEECVRQWQPHTAVTRLAEWEEAVGLPDPCFGPDQTPALRRSLLLARLRGLELAYPDSSPAATGSIEALCAAMGYTVRVFYNVPFRVGRNRVGDRLGALDGVLYIKVTATSAPFRVGVNRVGDRLVQVSQDFGPLECYLRRIVPARYRINVSLET
ncbi:putative phage tail protein [Variovorax sp. E3]|uniref:putative phage tail protein n=1 Tax=Variovorax sp. E3 TaxID=1914993 RepID=UPI0022B6CBFB|nr:putative phage tail protein [Variovorax sp. E3]